MAEKTYGVPQWLFALFVGAFMSAAGIGAMALFNMRETQILQGTRIEALEKFSNESKSDSKRLDKIETKLDILLDRVLPMQQKGK